MPDVHSSTLGGCTRARGGGMKEWRRDWKIQLIEELNPGWLDLYPGIL